VPVRLDRLLANNGLGSRREVHELVRRGRVTVGGRVERRVDAAIDGDAVATVAVDGEELDHPEGLLIALHKPPGRVCTHAGSEGPTVYALLPARWMARRPRPEAVGRLDRDSSGLLLVTDRHDLVHRLGAPGHEIDKRYRVTLGRAPSDPGSVAAAFADGRLVLDGHPCRPAEAVVDGDDPRVFHVVLHEGRHRQVRRMFGALGLDVVALERLAVGPYELGSLAPGAWRLEPLTGTDATA
jgi:16S rRNA pseudouridine516 synthase